MQLGDGGTYIVASIREGDRCAFWVSCQRVRVFVFVSNGWKTLFTPGGLYASRFLLPNCVHLHFRDLWIGKGVVSSPFGFSLTTPLDRGE
jgi:hypothetical protein